MSREMLNKSGFALGFKAGADCAIEIHKGKTPAHELTINTVSTDYLTNLGWYMGFHVNTILNLIPNPTNI